MPTPSLIIPSAPVYNEGNLYGLNVYGTQFAPEAIPFTRATTATRTNSAGLIELVPYNLVTYSEQFDNADWVKSEISILPNVIVAPIGDLTADKIVPSNVLGWHILRRSTPSTLTIGQSTVTYSIYVKISEYNSLRVGTNASASIGATFNLSTGVITNNTAISASIQNVGNGWYRCVVTGVIGSVLDIMLVDNSGNTSFSGNGTDGIFIWGAQLVQGTSALPYLKTETRLNRPRVDFSLGGCPNLLLEPQRTNVNAKSNDFTISSGYWYDFNFKIPIANQGISPDGNNNAWRLPLDSILTTEYGKTIGLTIGDKTAASIWAKGSETAFILEIKNVTNTDILGSITVNLNTGAIISGSGTVESYGNGWYRITTVGTSTITNGYPRSVIRNPNSACLIYGFQYEAGAYATSYIPTTTTSVTRNADSFTESNVFSRGMITAAGGTWFVELRNNRALISDAVSQGIYLETGTGWSNGFSIRGVGGVAQRVRIYKNLTPSFTTIYITTTDTCKLAIKWNGATADVFENGVKVVAATAFNITNMQNLGTPTIDIPAYIKSMALYPTPLSDTDCINLTTL